LNEIFKLISKRWLNHTYSKIDFEVDSSLLEMTHSRDPLIFRSVDRTLVTTHSVVSSCVYFGFYTLRQKIHSGLHERRRRNVI